MPRYKDVAWNLDEDDACYERAHLAVLMDIRDELKRLNGLLHCANFVGIPTDLRRIARNTAKPTKERATS